MKPTKHRAYLVSVSQKREAVRVYAVLGLTPDEALENVALASMPDAKLTVVGDLSRDLVKRLGIKLGVLRLV